MPEPAEAEALRAIIAIQQDVIDGLSSRDTAGRLADLARQLTGATDATVTVTDGEAASSSVAGDGHTLQVPLVSFGEQVGHVTLRAGDVEPLTRLAPTMAATLRGAIALDACRSEDETYRMILDRSSDVVMQIDDRGTILWASPSIRSMLGRELPDTVGLPAWDFVAPDRRDDYRQAVAHAFESRTELRGEYPFTRADGSRIWVDVLSTVVDHDGALTRITRLRDITRTHQDQDALRRSEETLRKTMQYAPVGMCLIAPDGSFMTVNQALCALLDRPEPVLLKTTWQELTHPEDLEIDLSHVQDVLDGRMDSYRMTKRYLRPDGGVVWGDLSVSCVRDETGKVEFFISQIADITEIKERELVSARAIEHYRMVAETTADVLVQIDPYGNITWVSPNCADLLGRSPEDLIGELPVGLLPETHRARVMSRVSHLLNSREEGHFHMPLLRADGTQVWLDVASTPMYDDRGTHLGLMARLRDISEEVALREDLERRATHDPLTGLISRDEGYRRLTAMLDHAPRTGHTNLLAFIDVDDLKTVNDTYGHDVGDELLRIIADRIRSHLREGDTVARVGGDEMIAILSGVRDVDEGVRVLDKLVRHVHRPYRYHGHSLTPAVSIGVTVMRPSESADTALRRADRAMYQAKHAGGSTVRLTEVPGD